jgi:hypothetical protein
MPGSDVAIGKLVQQALWLRIFAAVAIYVLLPLGYFTPDENNYSIGGDLLAQYWRGEFPFEPYSSASNMEGKGYFFLVAALYLPFGKFVLFPKLLNAWIGSLAVLELFRLTRLISGSDTAALRAAKFMAYFPSMILWSSQMIRDVWVQWLLIRLAREVVELKGRIIVSRIFSIVALIWLLTQFRAYLLYAAVGPFVLSFMVGRVKDIGRNYLLGAGFAIALTFVGGKSIGGKIQSFDLVELQRLRSWTSSENVAASGFGAEADVSTVEGLVNFLPVGLAYFFFAPFPWQIGSVSKTLAIPETLYFYTLVPGIFAGIAFLVRKRLADSVGLLLMTVTVTFGYAVGQGNVGTLYRHKAQVMSFYYAFAAIGIENRRRRASPVRSSAPPLPTRVRLRVGPTAAYAPLRRES